MVQTIIGCIGSNVYWLKLPWLFCFNASYSIDQEATRFSRVTGSPFLCMISSSIIISAVVRRLEFCSVEDWVHLILVFEVHFVAVV